MANEINFASVNFDREVRHPSAPLRQIHGTLCLRQNLHQFWIDPLKEIYFVVSKACIGRSQFLIHPL